MENSSHPNHSLYQERLAQTRQEIKQLDSTSAKETVELFRQELLWQTAAVFRELRDLVERSRGSHDFNLSKEEFQRYFLADRVVAPSHLSIIIDEFWRLNQKVREHFFKNTQFFRVRASRIIEAQQKLKGEEPLPEDNELIENFSNNAGRIFFLQQTDQDPKNRIKLTYCPVYFELEINDPQDVHLLYGDENDGDNRKRTLAFCGIPTGKPGEIEFPYTAYQPRDMESRIHEQNHALFYVVRMISDQMRSILGWSEKSMKHCNSKMMTIAMQVKAHKESAEPLEALSPIEVIKKLMTGQWYRKEQRNFPDNYFPQSLKEKTKQLLTIMALALAKDEILAQHIFDGSFNYMTMRPRVLTRFYRYFFGNYFPRNYELSNQIRKKILKEAIQDGKDILTQAVVAAENFTKAYDEALRNKQIMQNRIGFLLRQKKEYFIFLLSQLPISTWAERLDQFVPGQTALIEQVKIIATNLNTEEKMEDFFEAYEVLYDDSFLTADQILADRLQTVYKQQFQ